MQAIDNSVELPANLRARGADHARDNALPANGIGLWRNDVGLDEQIICDLVSPIRQGLHMLRANAELGVLVLGAKLIDRLREALLGCTNGVFLHPAVACPGELGAIRARARRGSYAKTEEDQARQKQLHSNPLKL